MTTLGTPLTHHATKVMLLGSGELGKEVIIALQRLGVETIAVDRYNWCALVQKFRAWRGLGYYLYP